METAIIGLPLSGKTTFFNALTGRADQTGGYVGGQKTANVADAEVPDERVDKLTRLFQPKRRTLAAVRLRDMQIEYTPDKGFSLSTIGDLRTCDAVTLVVRAFRRDDVPHPLDRNDPASDLEVLLDSLVFSDYEVAQRKAERLEKEGRKKEREYFRLKRIIDRLEEGKILGPDFLSDEDRSLFSGFSLLTAKPMFVVANTSDEENDTQPLAERTEELGLSFFELRGLTEMEIAQLSPDDQKEFLKDLGLKDTTRERFLTTMYRQLNLISFLTAGEDEVRAWSIKNGTAAAGAAGKIHSDLERGFIRAEVVPWHELFHAGGFSRAKTSGKLRLEGKRYVVQDGDVLNIRFNVKSKN